MFLTVGNQHFNSDDIAVYTPDGYIYFAGRPSCVQIDNSFRDQFGEKLLQVGGFIELEGGRLLGLDSIAIISNGEARLRGSGLLQAVVLSAKDLRAVIMATNTDLEPVGTALVRLSCISFVTSDGYVRLKDEGMSVKVTPEEAVALTRKLSGSEDPQTKSADTAGPVALGSALKEIPKQLGEPEPPKAA